MIKAEILEALPKLNAEERQEIRARLNELDSEKWFDNGELSEQEKAIIEARLDEIAEGQYNVNPFYPLKPRLLIHHHADQDAIVCSGGSPLTSILSRQAGQVVGAR
jgi:hypothetical protein